jgi:hypothetical protein
MHLSSCYGHIISYIGFRQVIRAHITCLCFIFPEPKAREIYNTDAFAGYKVDYFHGQTSDIYATRLPGIR